MPAKWGVFQNGGDKFDLSHLDDRIATVRMGEVDVPIFVTFSDHCFTADPEADDKRPAFPGCSRKDGRFCTKRYAASLEMWKHIERAMGGRVWMGQGDRYLVITVDLGEGRHYIVSFSLEKLKGRADAKLLMRVRTGFHRTDDKHVATYGEVRFVNLVGLILKGKLPPRIYAQNRRTPW